MGRVDREVDFAVLKDVRLRYGAIVHGDMDGGGGGGYMNAVGIFHLVSVGI